jgi:hypothetical protein
MIKNILLKLGIVFIGLLSGIAQLNAEEVTYYFTGAVDNNYLTIDNWNTERNGSGTIIPNNTYLQNTSDVTLIIPSGKAVTAGAIITITGHLIIENEGSWEAASSSCSINMIQNASIEVSGTLTIPGTSSSSSINGNTSTALEVKPGGVVNASLKNSLNVNNNGIINGTTITVALIEGTGILSSRTLITATDFTNSNFFQANGGTSIYFNSNKNDVALLSTYNSLEIKSFATADKKYTGQTTIFSNLSLIDNVKQVTLSDTIDVKGNLNIENSKLITSKAIKVAGDVSTSGLAEGSVLNVILTGTAQNMQGTGITNLTIPAGTTVTMTGNLTVTNLVSEGTINENGYTLTVINQIATLIAQLQSMIGDVAANRTEADYTPESWADLQEAIANAQPFLAVDANPTSTQLDNAIAAVTEAINALVTNKSALQTWVNAIKGSYNNPTVYTGTTYSALQDSIASVETFLAEATAITPAELNEKKAVINTAISALVRMTYTFYLITGGNSSPMSYEKWNTKRDESGIQAVAFTPENIGHTYIVPANISVSSTFGGPVFYGSHLILEAGTARVALSGISLNGSNLTVESGRTFSSSISASGGKEVIRVNSGGTIENAFISSADTVIVDEGGKMTNSSFNGDCILAANGRLELNGSQLSRITGTGTIIASAAISLNDDISQSTFLQSGGGTLVYRAANTLLPSYNHLTIEEVNKISVFSREAEGAYPAVTVYGNLLLSNNSRRITISNPLDIKGDFTVDYDIEDEAILEAQISVSGDVSLSGLLTEDNALHVTLAGETQNLSGAGFTTLNIPSGITAVLAGDLAVENVLTLNGLLDRNGHTLSFGSRTGEGILTDSQLAARLQSDIDDANAAYPSASSALYTPESWAVFASAVAAGETLLSGETPAEAADLETAIAAIETAIAGLKLVTGVAPVPADEPRISVRSSSLVVTGYAGVSVTNLLGRKVYNGRVNGEKTIVLPTGVYVVAVNGKTTKIIIN